MPLTKAQRRKINAQNAQSSTGPRDTSRTRFNALKHGLRAEVLVLPDEDPEAIQQRSDAWNDYYQPQDPAEQHLVNECVRATLLSDRVDRFHTAEVAKQVRASERKWVSEQVERREHNLAMLTADPAGAVRELKRFGFGLQHLIEAWERLDEVLVEKGCWDELQRDEAIRLLGHRADPETLRQTPVAWITRLYNLICRPKPLEQAFEWLFHPSRVPDEYRDRYRIDFSPDAETCRRSLRAMIADELEPLREAADELQIEIDDPDHAESGDRAAILRDETSARLFLRYHAESRTSFHRAYSALVRTIAARDEEPTPVVALPASPNEADRVEEPSPNEAKPVEEASSTSCKPTISVEREAEKTKSGNDGQTASEPKTDGFQMLRKYLAEQKLAVERSEVVPISVVGADR